MAEVSVHAQDTDVSQAKLGNYFQNSKNDLTYLRNRTCYIDDALSISERTCARCPTSTLARRLPV